MRQNGYQLWALNRAGSGLGILHGVIQLYFVTMEMINEELKLRDIEYVTRESIITLNFQFKYTVILS